MHKSANSYVWSPWEKIDADMAEANGFDFSGTPGFLLNGIPVRGAYPVEKFDSIIEKLKENGKKG